MKSIVLFLAMCLTSFSASAQLILDDQDLIDVLGLINDELTLFDHTNDQMKRGKFHLDEAYKILSESSLTPAKLVIHGGPVYDYGLVAATASVPRTFFVTNDGGNTATNVVGEVIAKPFVFLGGKFPGTGGTCTATILKKTSCTIIVAFEPTKEGDYTGQIALTYGDSVATVTSTLNLKGKSVLPGILEIDYPGVLDFGTTTPGSPKEAILTITNKGALDATSIAGGGLKDPFYIKGGLFPGDGGDCKPVIKPTETCTIVLYFVPSKVNVYKDTFLLLYNNGATSKATELELTGKAIKD